jgi:hypothetical protein
MSCGAASALRVERAVWPFLHSRLGAFFVLLAAAASLGGRAWLGAAPDTNRERMLVTLVALVRPARFGGVFFHRLRALPLRWRETQSYLATIETESRDHRDLMEVASDALRMVEPAGGRVLQENARAGDAARHAGVLRCAGERPCDRIINPHENSDC